MSEFNLSYCITTFNKLPYLKEVMRLLLLNLQPDEEIVIADGGSKDGTKEYLQKLFDEGAIHQFISEKDAGEAHGYNKTFLMARGVLIKVITDDDVFNYKHIRRMKQFMFANPDIDVLTGNIISVNVMQSITFFEFRKSYQVWFEQWVNKKFNSTFFSCLPLMIRKSSCTLIGLFDTSFKHVDLEFSVRITALKRKVAFYTGIVSIGLVNGQSVSAQEDSYTIVLKKEIERLKGNFNYVNRQGVATSKVPWIRKNIFERNIVLWKVADKLKLCLKKETIHPDYNVKLKENVLIPNTDVAALFRLFEDYLEQLPPLAGEKKFIV